MDKATFAAATHSCKLGKWMDSDGARKPTGRCRGAGGVRFFVRAARTIHSASSLALQTHDTGDDATSTRAVTDMHRLSSLLVAGCLNSIAWPPPKNERTDAGDDDPEPLLLSVLGMDERQRGCWKWSSPGTAARQCASSRNPQRRLA